MPIDVEIVFEQRRGCKRLARHEEVQDFLASAAGLAVAWEPDELAEAFKRTKNKNKCDSRGENVSMWVVALQTCPIRVCQYIGEPACSTSAEGRCCLEVRAFGKFGVRPWAQDAHCNQDLRAVVSPAIAYNLMAQCNAQRTMQCWCNQ